jgi:mannitol-1-phosphate 5-dehydrogenase
MKALQFGAGNIGRGFLGQLLCEGGYEIVFVDVQQDLIDNLNKRGCYPLKLVNSAGEIQYLTVNKVRAINSHDIESVVKEFSSADLVGTSVGANILPKVAPLIAAGIRARSAEGKPIDILLCENQWHASTLMLGFLDPLLDGASKTYFESSVGLVETVIGRMVPKPGPDALAEDPLLIVAEPYEHLPCARDMFRAPIPNITGMEPVADFDVYESRKLYLHNASHAAFAYLGYPHYHFIWECVADEDLTATVLDALEEVIHALASEYGLPLEDLRAFATDIVYRYSNKTLGDTVERVAADPMRKLRPEDRLIGAANLCMKHNIVPKTFAKIIQAALRFNNPEDHNAVEMQKLIVQEGIAQFLKEHCGVEVDSELGKLIVGTEIG